MQNASQVFTMAVLVAVIMVGGASAQTTAFTFQGTLNNASAPATGNYDFEFALFDAVSGGAQVGATLPRNSVAVANGIFTVSLDFGGQFPGANRFLEIRVRQTGGGAFTPLAPRQQIVSSPHAVQSLNATQLGGVAAANYLQATGNGSGLTNLNANNISTGTLGVARGGTGLTTTGTTGNYLRSNGTSWVSSALQSGDMPTGSGNYVQNGTTQQATSNFNISGIGTANTFRATTQYQIGPDRVFSVPGTDNTLVGVGAGAANSSGINNSFFGYNAGAANTVFSGNSYFGANAGPINTGGGNSFFGSLSGSNTTDGFSNLERKLKHNRR